MNASALPPYKLARRLVPTGSAEELLNHLSLELVSWGYAEYIRQETISRHGPYNEIQIIPKGKSRIAVDSRTMIVKGPCLVLLSLGKEATFVNERGLFKANIQFRLGTLGSDFFLGEPPLWVDLPDPKKWWTRFLEATDPGNVFQAKAIAWEALGLLSPKMKGVAERRSEEYSFFGPLLSEFKSTKVNDFSLNRLSSKFGYNPQYLTQKFKKHFGMGIKAFFLKEKIRIIKERLLSSPIGLEELAGDFGFFDSFHLSRTFKKITGASPRHFREKFSTGTNG